MKPASSKNISIKGIGVHLPATIRRNDWWSEEIVSKWQEKRKSSLLSGRSDGLIAPSKGVQLAIEAMRKLENDPFGGVRERRVRPDGTLPSQMEIAAAEDAIARAQIDRSDIGMLLTTTQGPDTLLVANAAVVHRELNLKRQCISTGIDAVCNGFSIQMTLAENAIRSGTAKYVLLVQSTTVRSIFDRQDQNSPFFGDAATAVVIGASEDDDGGLLSAYHVTDGSLYSTLQIGNPDGPWYEAIPRVYVGDKTLGRRMTLNLIEYTAEAVIGAMSQAGIVAGDIDFFATHQGTPWIREASQVLIDAPQARSCDTFAWTASVGPCNVPLALAMGEREGLIKRGDLVVVSTCGSGATIGGMVIRW